MKLLRHCRRRRNESRTHWIRASSRRLLRERAFTLVELMIVCAIIGMVLTIAIPTIYRYFHPDSLEGTVRNLVEACSDARANAILHGNYTELVIHPQDRSFRVVEGSSPSPASNSQQLESLNVEGQQWRMQDRKPTQPTGGGIFSGAWPRRRWPARASPRRRSRPRRSPR